MAINVTLNKSLIFRPVSVARGALRRITAILAPMAAAIAVGTFPATAQVSVTALQGPPNSTAYRESALMLFRSTMLALDQANKTGNYSVFRALAAPSFQKNTADRLAAAFTIMRERRLDLSGVAMTTPNFQRPPRVQPDGTLHMGGMFFTGATPVGFDLMYRPIGGFWRLNGIDITPRPVMVASRRRR